VCQQGFAYGLKGDVEKKLEYYYKAQAVKINMYGEDSIHVATSYYNIGGFFLCGSTPHCFDVGDELFVFSSRTFACVTVSENCEDAPPHPACFLYCLTLA